MSRYFVTCARGVEEITAGELTAIGATKTENVPGGVYFDGDQDVLYKAHLWLRTGNRILLPLRTFPCVNPDELYENLYKFKWETFLREGFTFAVDCTISGRSTPSLSHSHYAKLKAKDAIVDRMREKTGQRPDVDAESPDINIVIYIRNGECTLNMDATGDSLHERGYRGDDAAAPLKETLAASILKLAGWDPSTPLIDPMCGSGTLLAEAALMATNTAPGLSRLKFLFMNWPDFHEPRWEKWVADAEAKITDLPKGQIFGMDQKNAALKQARTSLKILGYEDSILLEQRILDNFTLPVGLKPGLLVVNPPYGERLGEEEELKPLYKTLGDTFKQKLPGWRAAVITGSPTLAKQIGLKTTRKFPLFNGPIECRLLTFDMYSGSKNREPSTGGERIDSEA